MSFKNLLIVGLFGLTVMGATQSAANQTPVPVDNKNIVQVNWWCAHHPGMCHRHHPQRHHCYHNPHKWGCRHFCQMNPRACW